MIGNLTVECVSLAVHFSRVSQTEVRMLSQGKNTVELIDNDLCEQMIFPYFYY